VTLNLAYQWGALASLDTVHWILVPIIVIAHFSIALTLIAQSLDKIFNPRVKARHQKTVETEEFRSNIE